MPSPDRCNSCPAEIVWLVNDSTGRRAPIDAKPVANGNVLPDFERGIYRIVPKAERPALAGRLHTNHFVSCPGAKGWRGGWRDGV